MGLDFYLADTSDHLIVGTLEPRLSLPGESLTGILAAIHEFVGPTTAHGGPTLDEFGTNVFSPSDLPRLRESLLRAARHFAGGPPRFEVWVGRLVVPVERDVYQELTSSELLAVLVQIQHVVDEGIRAGAWLFAVGD